jgi:hypothetical protein
LLKHRLREGGEGGVHILVSHTQDKWLRSIFGPHVPVIESGGIPDNFEENLRDLHRMCGRAGAATLKSAAGGVGYMGFMVIAVEVLTIPASVSVGACY